ncbi:hypothetical protein [Streptomyces albogriseolus]|uniref:hypothetical protein n=1 Tax=Streptomyces albogriseolus TaxID=1887 RepID=UPI0034609034
MRLYLSCGPGGGVVLDRPPADELGKPPARIWVFTKTYDGRPHRDGNAASCRPWIRSERADQVPYDLQRRADGSPVCLPDGSYVYLYVGPTPWQARRRKGQGKTGS